MDVKPNSPAAQKAVKRRPRPSHSCLPCRSKKLKCDQSQPCRSCIKSHRIDECKYELFPRGDHPAQANDHQDSPYSEAPSEQVEDLLKRVSDLEKKLGSSESSRISGNVKVKGPRTRYYGIDDGFVERFENMGDFLREAIEDTSTREDLLMLRNSFPKRPREPADDGKIMRASLPSWSQCSASTEVYFRDWENVYRVLHGSKFLREGIKGLYNLSDHSTSHLALITIIVSPFIEPRETMQALRSRFAAVENWYHRLRRRQRITLASLQTECLLTIALQALGTPADEMWKAAGTLLKSAMIMGIHRDPSEILELSIYEGEIRRRLFYTIAELETQYAFIVGLPSSLTNASFTCKIPANIDDKEIFPDVEATAFSKSDSIDYLTNCSYQNLLAKSLRARIALVDLVGNSIAATDSVDELLPPIKSALAQAHRLFENYCSSAKGSLLGHVMLDSLLRRPILVYYRAQLVKHRKEPHRASHEVLNMCKEHSEMLLGWIDSLNPMSLTQTLASASHHLHIFQHIFQADIMRSLSVLCLIVKSLNDTSHENQVASSSLPNSTLVPAGLPSIEPIQASNEQTETSNLSYFIENKLRTLLKTCDEPGDIIKDVVFLFVALHLATNEKLRGSRQHYDRGQTLRKIFATCSDSAKQNPVFINEIVDGQVQDFDQSEDSSLMDFITNLDFSSLDGPPIDPSSFGFDTTFMT